jgi:hypothetical protein
MKVSPDSKRAAPRGRIISWLVLGAVVLGWIFFQLGELTGHVFGASRFILGDQGSYLYAIGRWQAGEALYRDFAWQYGPLALGWYRIWAAVGGNTPLTLVVVSSLTFAVAWVLVARLLVRGAGWKWGGFLAVATLLPVMSATGTFGQNGPHGAIEMLLLTGCAWSLATEGNPRWRPWQLGVLAGLLHWVRFGPQLAALTAILLIVAMQSRPEAVNVRDWFRRMTAFAWRLLAAYVLTIAPLLIWIFAALPLAAACDQLWPSYMIACYAATFPNRWPQITSVQEVFVIWLPPAMGVGLMLHRLITLGKRAGPSSAAPGSGAVAGLLFFPLYYLVCFAVIFRSDNPIYGHLWLAWPGLALVVGIKSRIWRSVCMMLVLPALLGNLAGNWGLVKEERAYRLYPLTLPNGQQLWFYDAEARHFAKLQKELEPAPRPRRLAIMLTGGGIHHFFGTQRVGREWWFLPEFIRPWEERAEAKALLQHDLILIADRYRADHWEGTKPGAVNIWLPLPRAVTEALQGHLSNARKLEGIGVLIDVQPQAAAP